MGSVPRKKRLRVLFLLSSRFGQVRKIGEFIGAQLKTVHPDLELIYMNLDAVSKLTPADYALIVFGASIRYGHFHRNLGALTRRYAAELNRMPTALFTVNLVARRAAKRSPETNSYTRKFLQKSPYRPRITRVFAGALQYSRYGFFDKRMIQLIMRLTGGETDLNTNIEYTDWGEVEAFSHALGAELLPINFVSVR